MHAVAHQWQLEDAVPRDEKRTFAPRCDASAVSRMAVAMGAGRVLMTSWQRCRGRCDAVAVVRGQARRRLRSWTRPVMVMFSDGCPVSAGLDQWFVDNIPTQHGWHVVRRRSRPAHLPRAHTSSTHAHVHRVPNNTQPHGHIHWLFVGALLTLMCLGCCACTPAGSAACVVATSFRRTRGPLWRSTSSGSCEPRPGACAGQCRPQRRHPHSASTKPLRS